MSKNFVRKISIVLVIFMMSSLIFACSSGEDNGEKSKTEQGISYENYLNIKNDSSYQEVCSMLGSEGSLTDTLESNSQTYTTYLYTSTDENFKIKVYFENNKCFGKVYDDTSWKKYEKSEISLKSYEELSEGMSYDEVKNILKDSGYLTLQIDMKEYIEDNYFWFTKNNGYVSVMFKDGILVSKDKTEL